MKKSHEKSIVDVEPQQMTDTTWSVRTKFLHMPVGDYLGKSEGLTHEQCVEMCAKWRKFQGKKTGSANFDVVARRRSPHLKH